MSDTGGDTKEKGAYVEVHVWRFMKPTLSQWLESMAQKHKLSGPSEAVRCCVDYVASDYDNNLPWIGSFEHEQSCTYILSEEQRMEGPAFELSQQQVEWIDSVRSAFSYPDMYLHRAFFLWNLINHCQNLEEEDNVNVFGMVRCKTIDMQKWRWL